MKRASRLENLSVYPFARWENHVADARQQGLDVIRLDVGNPDQPPPDAVTETLCRSACQADHHGYPGHRGLPELREAMADYYERRFGVVIDPDGEVVPLIGSKEGIVSLALACLDPGDLVLVPDPSYSPYIRGAALAGAEVYCFPLLLERDFLPNFAAIPAEIADRAALMWLNYPNNPTGAIGGLELFEQATDFARRHNLLLCHDAAYCDVGYDGYVPPSLMEVPGAAEVAIEINSFSKAWNMAGWRIGMAVGKNDLLKPLAQIYSNLHSGIFWPIQEAAAQALSTDEGWLAARNQVYRQRLEIVVETLGALDIEAQHPLATPYVWARNPSRWRSEDFALALLRQKGVSVAPGTIFGAQGEGYVRISVTRPTPRVREAMERMRQFVQSDQRSVA